MICLETWLKGYELKMNPQIKNIFSKFFGKINVIKIIVEHIGTLKQFDDNKYSKTDVFLFIVLPLIVAFILTFFNIKLTNNLITIFITAYSIFAALLFNLLFLIYDLGTKNNSSMDKYNGEVNGQPSESKLKLKRRLLKETYVNISYSITIAIFLLILLITLYVIIETINPLNLEINPISPSIESIINSAIPVLSFCIYYLVLQFILTLFMILKRIYILLSKMFD